MAMIVRIETTWEWMGVPASPCYKLYANDVSQWIEWKRAGSLSFILLQVSVCFGSYL